MEDSLANPVAWATDHDVQRRFGPRMRRRYEDEERMRQYEDEERMRQYEDEELMRRYEDEERERSSQMHRRSSEHDEDEGRIHTINLSHRMRGPSRDDDDRMRSRSRDDDDRMRSRSHDDDDRIRGLARDDDDRMRSRSRGDPLASLNPLAWASEQFDRFREAEDRRRLIESGRLHPNEPFFRDEDDMEAEHEAEHERRHERRHERAMESDRVMRRRSPPFSDDREPR